MQKERKIFLSESEMPEAWYNIQADLPEPLDPALHPGTLQPIGPQDLWSDDLRDPAYNHLVRAPHRYSHERLARPDRLYDLVLVTDWNWPRAVPGRGSAIFVHSWRSPQHPTAGCVALCRDDLLWIARRMAPGSRMIVKSGL